MRRRVAREWARGVYGPACSRNSARRLRDRRQRLTPPPAPPLEGKGDLLLAPRLAGRAQAFQRGPPPFEGRGRGVNSHPLQAAQDGGRGEVAIGDLADGAAQ